MVDFRRMIPVLAVLAFLLGSAVTASAQPLSCTTNGAINTPVRAEGLTELVGDLQVTCTGGTPTANGLAIPTVNIQVFLNTQITSRCMGSTTAGCIGSTSEALLLLDEPATNNQWGCATSTCLNAGNGLGSAIYGSVAQTGSGTAGSPSNPLANRNVFQGIQTAVNAITFIGIPIDPPGTNQRIIRITNIRANANSLGVAAGTSLPNAIQEQFTATPSTFLPVSGLATQAVGSVQTGMSFTLRNADGSSGYTTFIGQQCISRSPDGAPAANTQIAFLRYTELFATAFKKRSVLANATSNPSITSEQNDLTAGTYNTEGGFRNSALLLPAAKQGNNFVGDADWGTRLKAVFNNIPTGVRLYVDSSVTSGLDVATLTGSSLSNGETLPYTQLSTSARAELTVTNNSASAVWEILQSDPLTLATLNFGVYLRYTASPGTNSPSLGTMTVNGSYSPTSTSLTANAVLVPRFADTSKANNLATFVLCATNLLFPYITSQLGFDTGLAISATASDPFSTSPQGGTCSLNWYGSAFTGTTTTPTIPSGTTYTTLASTTLNNVAGGFSGYMIAICKFQYGHGFAFVSDLGARNIAMGYLALVIPDVPRSAQPFPCAAGGNFASSAGAGINGCVTSGEQLGQ